MTTSTCPSREALYQYSIGMLNGEQRDALDQHLDGCPDCQATIVTLDDADDTVAGRLRMPLSSESFLAEPQLNDAMAAAMVLPLSMLDAKAGRSSEGGSASDMPRGLGEYQLLEELGRGGMGTVYKALQTKLDRVVALKVLSRGRVGDRQAINRFEREMKAVGRLAHPNIVQAYDAREINEMPVLIMEFVDGLDLAELVRRCTLRRTHHAPHDGIHHTECDEYGAVPVAEACELIRRTALALQCAHEHGLVHRDIKPSNIMLARSGEVKLLDLGLARFYAEGGGSVPPAPASEEMTDTGQAMGTADYMAPEQASDSRTVDIRADIYSLGCTLYKLLSGRAPFSGPAYRSTLDKLNAHVHQPVPPIRDFVPEVPEELAAILVRMLAKDPGERFATPADVAVALELFCRGANLTDLIVRAMASENGPLSFRERVRVRASASSPLPRRPILRRILIGLSFLGALAAAFAAGVVITIKKNGENYQLEVPKDSHTIVDENGNASVQLAGAVQSPVKNAADPTRSTLTELKVLRGRWKVVRVEKGKLSRGSVSWMLGFNGKQECPADLGYGYLDFLGGDLNIFDYTDIRRLNYSFTIDPAASPKAIDLTQLPHQKGAPNFVNPRALGIYEIEGDRMELCFAEDLAGVKPHRPSQFVVEPDSGEILVVLERSHPSLDEAAIQGQWNVITEIANGKTVPKDDDESVTWTFRGNDFSSETARRGRTTWRDRGMSGLVVLDASKKPKSITMSADITSRAGSVNQSWRPASPGDGSRESQTQMAILLGIYNLENDQLTVAYHAAGTRPETFESAPGSGVTILVLQRPTEQAGTVGAQAPGALIRAASASATPQKAAETPPEVPVVHPIVRNVSDHLDFTGQTRVAKTAEIRARVSGELVKVHIKPGMPVKQGDLLMEIDPRLYQAEVDQAANVVRQAQVRLEARTEESKRLQMLVRTNAVSQQEADQAKNQRAEAEAALQAAKAAWEVARLRLEYTRIVAPFAGVISGAVLDEGNLATADKTALATITSIDPLHLDFRMDETSLVVVRRKGAGKSDPVLSFPVLCGLDGDKGYPYRATMDFVDSHADPATGWISCCAKLANKDGALIPGMCVRVRLVTSEPYQALLVPETAIFKFYDQAAHPQPTYHPSVFIVTDQNVVQRREVEFGRQDDDGMRIAEKGLTVNDWIIETGGVEYPTGTNEGWKGMTVKPKKPPTAVPPSSSNDKPNAVGPAAEIKPDGVQPRRCAARQTEVMENGQVTWCSVSELSYRLVSRL